MGVVEPVRPGQRRRIRGGGRDREEPRASQERLEPCRPTHLQIPSGGQPLDGRGRPQPRVGAHYLATGSQSHYRPRPWRRAGEEAGVPVGRLGAAAVGWLGTAAASVLLGGEAEENGRGAWGG